MLAFSQQPGRIEVCHRFALWPEAGEVLIFRFRRRVLVLRSGRGWQWYTVLLVWMVSGEIGTPWRRTQILAEHPCCYPAGWKRKRTEVSFVRDWTKKSASCHRNFSAVLCMRGYGLWAAGPLREGGRLPTLQSSGVVTFGTDPSSQRSFAELVQVSFAEWMWTVFWWRLEEEKPPWVRLWRIAVLVSLLGTCLLIDWKSRNLCLNIEQIDINILFFGEKRETTIYWMETLCSM